LAAKIGRYPSVRFIGNFGETEFGHGLTNHLFGMRAQKLGHARIDEESFALAIDGPDSWSL
jgi:hypothetical protein